MRRTKSKKRNDMSPLHPSPPSELMWHGSPMREGDIPSDMSSLWKNLQCCSVETMLFLTIERKKERKTETILKFKAPSSNSKRHATSEFNLTHKGLSNPLYYGPLGLSDNIDEMSTEISHPWRGLDLLYSIDVLSR